MGNEIVQTAEREGKVPPIEATEKPWPLNGIHVPSEWWKQQTTRIYGRVVPLHEMSEEGYQAFLIAVVRQAFADLSKRYCPGCPCCEPERSENDDGDEPCCCDGSGTIPL
jgi:hypothetical protein